MSQSPERREVHRDSEPAQAAPAGGEDLSCKLFIANLTYNTRARDLEDVFVKFGRVKDVHIAEDRDTGRSKGFAFITMETPQEASDAVNQANGYEVDGRQIKVELSTGGGGSRRGPRGGDRRGGGGGGRSDICYDWQSGRCTRGSSCRFSHDDGNGRRDDDRRGSDRDGGRGRDDYRRDDYRRDDYRRDDYRRDDRGDHRREDFSRGGADRGYDRRDRDRSRDRY